MKLLSLRSGVLITVGRGARFVLSTLRIAWDLLGIMTAIPILLTLLSLTLFDVALPSTSAELRVWIGLAVLAGLVSVRLLISPPDPHPPWPYWINFSARLAPYFLAILMVIFLLLLAVIHLSADSPESLARTYLLLYSLTVVYVTLLKFFIWFISFLQRI